MVKKCECGNDATLRVTLTTQDGEVLDTVNLCNDCAVGGSLVSSALNSLNVA